VNSFLDTLKQLGPSRLGIMGAILVGLLFFFVFVSLRVSTPSMRLLYADLSGTDSAAVAAKLEESSIGYDVSADGAKIMVPDADVGRARMLLASAGLPNGGSMGYEIFDKQSGFGTTSFVQNINQVRALEGELARTIGAVQGIRSARVHLVLPQRELFSREKMAASASVFLNVQAGSDIERQQIVAIQSLVASAVQGLKTSDVAVIDSTGKLLAQGGEDGTSLASMKSEEMRRNIEANLSGKIEDQIGRIVGHGKVRATVNAEINFDKISTSEELFDPASQVVRSSQVTSENNKEQAAGAENVSVENNLPNAGPNLLNDASPTNEENRNEEITNFEISKTVRNVVSETGEIEKLSVAVVVDGSYTTEKTKDAEGNDVETRTYQARTPEEIERITALVRSAMGFDEDRGDALEVVNMQFADIETTGEFVDDRLLFGFEKDSLLDMAQVITISIMILLVVLLVLQPMVNRLLAVQPAEIDEKLEADLLAPRIQSPQLAAPEYMPPPDGQSGEENLINIQGVDGKVKASTMKKVEEIVSNYPSETVSVIRSWMTQET
jgi:flagellar M-ring protein FliF